MSTTGENAGKGRLGFELLVGLGLRGSGAIASFALTFFVARQFGADVVGLYQIGLTTAALVSLAASLGLPLILVREAAKLQQAGRFADLAATFKECRRALFWSGLIATIGIALFAWPFGNFVIGQTEAVIFILAFAPLVMLLPAIRLNNELLRSLGSVWLSQSLEGVFYTSLTAAVIAVLWLCAVQFPAIGIPIIYLLFATLAFFISAKIVTHKMSDWGFGAAQFRKTDGLVAISAPFIMLLSEWLILIIVGSMLGIADAGIYRTAVLICTLFQLVTASFATMAGPHLARAHAADDRHRFYFVLRFAGVIGIAICALPAAAVFLFPGEILNVFGPEFRSGAEALTVLTIAQLIGVANGPTAPATLMLGREKINFYIEVLVSFIAIAGALAFIGPYGLTGAAYALLAASVVRWLVSRVTLGLIWRRTHSAAG